MKNKFTLAAIYVTTTMILAILGTILYDYLLKTLGHEIRLNVIFGVSGSFYFIILLIKLISLLEV